MWYVVKWDSERRGRGGLRDGVFGRRRVWVQIKGGGSGVYRTFKCCSRVLFMVSHLHVLRFAIPKSVIILASTTHFHYQHSRPLRSHILIPLLLPRIPLHQRPIPGQPPHPRNTRLHHPRHPPSQWPQPPRRRKHNQRRRARMSIAVSTPHAPDVDKLTA